MFAACIFIVYMYVLSSVSVLQCLQLCMFTYLSCQEEAGHSDHTAVVLRKALHCKEAMKKDQSSLCCVWWPVSGSDDKEEGVSTIHA
eukprot:18741-Heterococcus_DN1.PRE.1